MRMQMFEEPPLAFHESRQHVDIKAGLSLFGAFDKSAPNKPVPLRIGIIGTTATVDGVRDWIERCKAGVSSEEIKLRELRPPFVGMDRAFGTTLELSDSTTRTVTRHELTAALGSRERLKRVTEVFVNHARDLAAKSGLNVLVIAPPWEVFELADKVAIDRDPPLDEAQEPAPDQSRPTPTPLNFHDLFKAEALELQLPCQVLRPDTYGQALPGRSKTRRLQDEATRAWNFHTAVYYKAGFVPWRLARQPASVATCSSRVSAATAC
jgi:hypothetical protein